MSESPDTKALEMAELQKVYSEKVLSTNRFIVSTLIILFVLAVVVEQELREHRREEQLLSKRVLDTSGKLRESKKELAETFAKLKKFLKSEGYEIGEESPATTYRSGGASATISFARSKCRLNFLCAPLEHLPKPILSVKEPDDLEKLQSAGTELKEELDKLEGGRDKIDGKNQKLQKEQLQLLDKGIGLYRNYTRVYGDYSGSARRLLATSEEMKKLNSSKRSIPTPFGSFDVQPRLALFALAFATVFSYFAFLSSVYRIRALAKIYCSGHPGGKAITGSDPAPFWLYSTEPELNQALTWRTKTWLTACLSLALHAGWLLMAAWLAWECWWRWHSVDSLLFDYRSFWVYALAACLILATLLAVWQFVPGRVRQTLRIVDRVGDHVSALAKRRAFLRGAVASAGVVALGGGVLYWLSRQSSQKIAKHCGLRSSELGRSSSHWMMMVNKRTRVLHHSGLCAAHLPAEKNKITLEIFGAEVCVHASYQGRILEEIAKSELSVPAPTPVEGENSKVKLSDDERKKRHKEMLDKAERAVPYLVKAIELNPLSYHLYDKLIRVYGRLSRYQDINNLLDGAQQSVARETAELSQSPSTPIVARRVKQLARAKKEFESRVAAVASRKEVAAAMRKLRTG